MTPLKMLDAEATGLLSTPPIPALIAPERDVIPALTQRRRASHRSAGRPVIAARVSF